MSELWKIGMNYFHLIKTQPENVEQLCAFFLSFLFVYTNPYKLVQV